MKAAIATLPWVETNSIKTDQSKLQVMFAVKDVKDFDEQAVLDVLKKRGYSGKKLVGPTLPAPAGGATTTAGATATAGTTTTGGKSPSVSDN